MIKSISNRISAIIMAMLVLISSTGFSMNIHYCQNSIAGISLVGNNDSCIKETKTLPCHSKKSAAKNGINGTDKDNCCHNERIFIQKTDLNAPSPQISSNQDLNLDLPVLANPLFILAVQTKFKPFSLYKSPLPDRDIRLLFQSFII